MKKVPKPNTIAARHLQEKFEPNVSRDFWDYSSMPNTPRDLVDAAIGHAA